MWELNTETNMDDDKGHCPYSKDTKKVETKFYNELRISLIIIRKIQKKNKFIFLFYFWKIFLSSKNYKKVKIVKNLENKQNYHKYPYKFFLFSLQYQFSGVFQAQ